MFQNYYIMAAPWGAIIQATASHINTGLNMWQNKRLQAREFREAARVRDWQSQEREEQNFWNLQQWNRENDWNLQQWNRENAYNSPAALAQRYVDAGFSPYNALGQNAAAASLNSPSVSSASAPSGAQGHVVQPPPIDMFGDAAQQFAVWQQQRLQEKAIQVERDKVDEQNRTLAFQRMKDGLMFHDQVRFLNANIDLAKSQQKLTTEQAAETAQQVLNLQNEIKQMQQYMAESGSRMKRNEVMNACDELRVNNETRRLIWDIWLTQKIGYNYRQDTINKYQEGENLKTYGKELNRQYRYNVMNEFSPFSLSVKKGMSVVSDILQPLVDVSRIGMFRSMSQQGYGRYMQIMQELNPSTRNPIGFR